MDSTQKKYQIGTPENRAFLAQNAEGLLTFGHRFPSPGGGSYYLGDDGTPWKDRSRETWITARMCHVYSLGVFLGHPGSAELADAALKGLCGELHDTENGGWYSGRTAEGGILPGKQCYAHAFVILAASSALRAGAPARRSFWMRRSRSMISASGTRKRVWPAIRGTRSSRSSTVTAG